MKKLLIIITLTLALAALTPGQAQAGTCTCKLTVASQILSFFGLPAGCGGMSMGGSKDEVKTGLNDQTVKESYLNKNETAWKDYNNGQDGYDWLYSGWSCKK